MATDFSYTPLRYWPSAVTALSGATFLAAVADRSETGFAAAAIAVAGSAAFARLAYRVDRGWPVHRAAMPAAAAVAGTGVVLLVLFSGTVLLPVLAAAAAAALLAVAVSVAALELAVRTSTPVWLCDPDGAPLPRPERYERARDLLSALLQQRPRRPANRVLRRIEEDLQHLARPVAGRPPVPVGVHVAVHPDTMARFEGWKPLQDVAQWLASRYAVAAGGALPDGQDVSISLHTSGTVPIGAAVVVAAARRPLAEEPCAQAQARVGAVGRQTPEAGPAAGPARGGPGSEAPPAARRPAREHGGQPGSAETAVAVLPDGTSQHTAARTEPRSGGPVLVLRPCLPDGRVVPDSGDHLLDGSGERVIGRSAAADIRISEPHVSRTHLRLIPRGDRWLAVDESNSGTTCNGRPLIRGTETDLRPGDVLELGTPGSSPRRVLLRVA